MREISGRLEEMPGEEGYPPYLASRIASFYERSGRAVCAGSDEREGTLSLIGAVSPPGGDLSDPVVQATLRVVQVFWSLEDDLASARHFPAISWLRSYSLYRNVVDSWADENVNEQWSAHRRRAMGLLQRESELEELVRLVGEESLSDDDRLLLEVARMIREDCLQQHAFDPVDTFASLDKQFRLLSLILLFHEEARAALEVEVELEGLLAIDAIESIARAKRIPQEEVEQFDRLQEQVKSQVQELMPGGEKPPPGEEPAEAEAVPAEASEGEQSPEAEQPREAREEVSGG
jgi:V/A-type H+-transporting ATPase subunit A